MEDHLVMRSEAKALQVLYIQCLEAWEQKVIVCVGSLCSIMVNGVNKGLGRCGVGKDC